MTFNELSQKINFYKTSTTSRSWTRTKESVYFNNDYLNVRRLDSSNKWLGIPHASEMEKQWSIIIDFKKEFRNLPKYRELLQLLDIRLTPVTKGELSGCYGIRVYGMKQEPSSSIIYDILNYIFN